ncbi:hypothetical protein ACWEN3_21600 [Streptomyces sp. NPDC004561]
MAVATCGGRRALSICTRLWWHRIPDIYVIFRAIAVSGDGHADGGPPDGGLPDDAPPSATGGRGRKAGMTRDHRKNRLKFTTLRREPFTACYR